MFLQVSVCPQGGGCLPQCMLGCQTPPDQADPPRTRQTPPDQADPPGPGRPPRTRQTPPDQADTPRTRQTPPNQADTPPPKQTPAYGLRAAGTHPTGIHSCGGNIFNIQRCLRLTKIDNYHAWVTIIDNVIDPEHRVFDIFKELY